MTERIAQMKRFFIQERGHHDSRKAPGDPYQLARDFAARGLSDTERAVERLVYMLDGETPVLFPGQTIVFARTIPTVPTLFTEEEKNAIASVRRLHELGELSNINVDYSRFLCTGFSGLYRLVDGRRKEFLAQDRTDEAAYLAGQLRILDALLQLITRYRDAAEALGCETAAQSLSRLLADAPHTLYDALQMQRIIHFTMWASGSYHNTLGRFDQYMRPYYEADLQSGVLTEETALELLEEYFLSFNIDSDLYPGMQQGDNGQSMVLGGITPDGKDGFSRLSELCLTASLELRLIDPKINLRVSKDTPLSIYHLGTQLTKQGLGFPQYTNDDIVIPGLEDMGYQTQDARNYAVAACWEVIIPGRGMDIVNIDALSFATAVRSAIVRHLKDSPDFESLFSHVVDQIRMETDRLCENTRGVYIFPSPFVSLMMDGPLETGRDISLGGVYNNYGLHGAGLATAADSLAAIKKHVYGTGEISKDDLLDAMEHDFSGQDHLLHKLRYDGPKMGNDEELPDGIASRLLDAFADTLKGRVNDRGGIFRPGTGSAMYYLWSARDLGATPDGRRAGEGFAANYSPSLFIHSKGPVSVVKSFAKPNLKRVCNGGPLTIELHDTLFRGEESLTKVAALIKSFIDLGGHQMQINAVNRDTMLDAQKHPENYRGLIVRVWGWSGYFVELDKDYQDHIIQRMEFAV